jgi:hypothetical protein
MGLNICDHWLSFILKGSLMLKKPLDFVELDQETRSHVGTNNAAYHLSRAQNTLRIWAMRNDGPVKALRINGRLAWPVAEIKRVLGVA